MPKRCVRIPIWIDKLALSSIKPNDYNPLDMIEVSRILTINGIFIMWKNPLTNTEVLRWYENSDYCNRSYKLTYGTRHITILNLKTSYVPWSNSNWASLMGGKPFRLALADELIWFMILSASHWVSSVSYTHLTLPTKA